MKVNNKLGRSYCPQTPQKFIRERQTRCFTSQVWNGATLLNYLFPVKAQKEWKWNPSLWQDSLCDDLHSPRGRCSPAPSPRLFPTTLSPPPATFLPQPDTSLTHHWHITFFSPHRVPSAAASSLERQKPFTEHHSVWQTFWKDKYGTVLFCICRTCTKTYLWLWWNIHTLTHIPTINAAVVVRKSHGK